MTSDIRTLKNKSVFDKEYIKEAMKLSFVKLNPSLMVKNPVMFTVEIGTAIMIFICAAILIDNSLTSTYGSFAFNIIIAVVLLLTLLFANFAEGLAEARGKAQANSLKKTRKETTANLVQENGNIVNVLSSDLKKGDIFIVSTGEIIPSDGEIIEGIATIDESAITGESAPVVREAGGDRSGVTGGTKVLSDKIKVKVTSEQGESFLDRMITLVEGAKRQKSPNEIALTILLSGFTLAFLIVTVTLVPFAAYNNTQIPLGILISLFVCLIPTTIGGLLSAIGIAGMIRALKANIITKSGKSVETAGDLDTILLDKTGTITLGNRRATNFFKVTEMRDEEFITLCGLSSYSDETPEGKSIIELAKQKGFHERYNKNIKDTINFSAQTRISGVNMNGGERIRKGAIDVMKKLAEENGNELSGDIVNKVKEISQNGGTPLVIAKNEMPVGVIQLEDIIKSGIEERFRRLKKMGVKTVMVTGDNPLTAAFIAKKSGVEEYIAEATPEDKLRYIKKEQSEGKLVAMMGDGTNDAPALAQADVGVAMNSGTQAAKEAGNMVDLDNDPTKLVEVVEIGKQLLMTRGSLTTFSISNDVAKYFAILPAIFASSIPGIEVLNIMGLENTYSAILSAVIFNAIIIPILIPLALKGIKYQAIGANKLLSRNLLIYGLGGLITPFIGIKIIDVLINLI